MLQLVQRGHWRNWCSRGAARTADGQTPLLPGCCIRANTLLLRARDPHQTVCCGKTVIRAYDVVALDRCDSWGKKNSAMYCVGAHPAPYPLAADSAVAFGPPSESRSVINCAEPPEGWRADWPGRLALASASPCRGRPMRASPPGEGFTAVRTASHGPQGIFINRQPCRLQLFHVRGRA
jgi:hypothetical protein